MKKSIYTNNQNGIVIWFTGLSGSGKSTIAAHLQEALGAKRKRVAILDGDDIRREKHKHLGFSRSGIRENNLLVAELAREKAQEFDFVLVTMISPYREDRAKARSIIGAGFVELFVNVPVEKCIERDPKGLYKKALAGEIPNFIGVAASSPYEVPKTPDIEIRTDTASADQCVDKVLQFLHKNGL